MVLICGTSCYFPIHYNFQEVPAMKKSLAIILISVAAFAAIPFADAGQSPFQVYPAVNSLGYARPANVDAVGNVTVNNGGTLTSLNIATNTVVKATAGRIVRVVVVVAGSAPGNVYDNNLTTGNVAANLITTIPNTVGVYDVEFPASVGIQVAPGTGQTVAVSYQ
jgi:hypothetical protein